MIITTFITQSWKQKSISILYKPCIHEFNNHRFAFSLQTLKVHDIAGN